MPPAYEVLLLNTAVPQIQAAQAGDTYVVPRDIAVNANMTVTGNVGIGTSSPAYKLDVLIGAGSGNLFRAGQSGISNGYTITSDGTALTHFWATTSEAMRLTSKAFMVGYTDDSGFSGQYNAAFSGNVGIGTSSPGYKFQVSSGATAATAFLSSTATPAYSATAYNGSNARIQLVGGGASGATTGINFSQGGLFEAYFGGVQESGGAAAFVWQGYSGAAYAERMRLDSSGNLGLGVTPSAWSASGLIDFSGNGVVGGSASGLSSNALWLGCNWYYGSGAYRYKTTNSAGLYQILGTEHRWYTAPSGTAGDPISFTQALTIDANRNLLLNGTSAGASAVGTLAIFNGTAPTGSVTDGIILYAEDVSSSSELKVRDEAGNVTTLSPHNFSLIPEGPSEDMAWAYYSEKGGKRINVDMLKLARMVEKLTGEKLVYEN